MSFLTSRETASGASLTDLIHIVITGDTSQNPAGSSYKIEMGAYKELFGEQDNFVRQLLININDLPEDYTEQDVCDYINNLPPSERTIAETDSKWNVIVGYFGS